MIKVVSLTTSYSNSCLNHATSKDFIPHNTIPSATGKWSGSIISMLKTLESTEKRGWKNHSLHAYNCTKNSSTGYATNLLLFGQKPRLSIDLILSPTDDANEDYSHFKLVEEWKTQMS